MNQSESASGLPQAAGGLAPRVLVLILLFSVVAVWECATLASLNGDGIWGHLRTGSWILDLRSVPHTGLFSQISQQTWRDFTWGYDVLTALLERILGLRAVTAIAALFRIALAVLTFLLAGGEKGRFWNAVGACVAVQFALSVIQLGPANISLLLFGITLLILLRVRQSENERILLALPMLFLIWTNMDLGFVYGIGMLLLFVVVTSVEGWIGNAKQGWLEPSKVRVPSALAGKIAIACVLSSLCNPYGYRAYESFCEVSMSALNRSLPGYLPMAFRRPQDYILLLLTMSAGLALGLRRSRDLFLIVLFVTCAFISFHAEREIWLVGLAAVAVLGSTSSLRRAEATTISKVIRDHQVPSAAGASLLLVALVFLSRVPSGRTRLLQQIARTQPVGACNYIHDHGLTQPLFNPYEWGGFVSWYLPDYPISIDQRRGLYPEDEEINYFKVMNAAIAYREYAPMKNARTLLFEKQSVIGEALRGMPGFRVAYEDDLAMVLQAHEKE